MSLAQLLVLFACSSAEQNSWCSFDVEQITVTQVSDFWACFGNSTGQGLVPVGSMGEDAVLGGEKIFNLCGCELCCVFIWPRGRRTGPAHFIGLHRHSYWCFRLKLCILNILVLHPLFYISDTHSMDTHIQGFRFDTMSWQASVSPAESISCFEQKTLRVGLVKHGLFDLTHYNQNPVIFSGNKPK